MKMICLRLVVCALLLQGCETSTTRLSSAPIDAYSQKSEQVAADLNRLYNDIQQNDCREIGTNLPRGHYYCSGVIIRATSDGDYLPWTHSPWSMARGSASFSWFRKDEHPTILLEGSGFILRNAVEGQRLGMPGFDEGFICLFPLDASTGGNPLHNGCISWDGKPVTHQAHPQPDIPHRNAMFAWGSCEDIGVTTFEQWVDYTGDLKEGEDTIKQCSWNADSQNGWRNALAVKPRFPAFDFYWNELLMATRDDGYGLKDLISAVFVDAEHYDNSIESARNFQRKLIANNSYAPIVRMDLRSDQPFSFHSEDQIATAR